MLTQTAWFLFAALASLGFLWLLFWLVNDLLRGLVDKVTDMPAAAAFYSRLFFVSMIVVGVGGISEADFSSIPNQRPLEYVWTLTEFIYDMLGFVLSIFALLMIVVTVLIAALRRPNER